ncbi:MAG: hypothetical protein AB1540_16170, partial [Bdellovibrionota bacterium]
KIRKEPFAHERDPREVQKVEEVEDRGRKSWRGKQVFDFDFLAEPAVVSRYVAQVLSSDALQPQERWLLLSRLLANKVVSIEGLLPEIEKTRKEIGKPKFTRGSRRDLEMRQNFKIAEAYQTMLERSNTYVTEKKTGKSVLYRPPREFMDYWRDDNGDSRLESLKQIDEGAIPFHLDRHQRLEKALGMKLDSYPSRYEPVGTNSSEY